MDRVIVEIREPGREPRRVSITATVEVGRECSGILLNDARVSRRHVVLTAGVEGLTLTDLGSSNGTTVDGRRVTDPVVVRAGEVIRLGGTEIVEVERTAPPPRPSSAPPERLTLLDPSPASPAPPAEPAPVPELPTVSSPIPTVAIVAEALRSAASTEGPVTLLVSALVEGIPGGEALRGAHREIVEYWLPRHAGRVLSGHGGVVLCAFPSARQGLLFATATQRGFATYSRAHPETQLAVRTALHSGDLPPGQAGAEVGLLLTGLAAAAAAGEILLSPSAHAAAGGGGEFTFDEPQERGVAGHGALAVRTLRWR